MEPEQSNDTTPTTEANNTSTGTNSGCPGGSGLKNSSFEVVSTECGTGKDKSSASFETNSLRVSGTITGADACHTAKLKRVLCEGETFTVSVQTYKPKNNDPCSMCVTDIEYEAAFTFENGLPQQIVVRHDGSDVLNESRE